VAQNIQKAVRAAGEHMAAIDSLRESGAWDKLPLNLRETAELREANPDATLSELAHMHNPPITKSGLNHRLQKLTELARETAIEK
jgi:DNA-binding protein WhiA